MGLTEKREQTNFSIWDSVVNDRIIQYEKLEGKYRNRGQKIEELMVENETLKEQMAAMNAKIDTVLNERLVMEKEINELKQENKNLRQWINNMENSTSWKVTKPIRSILDRIK